MAKKILLVTMSLGIGGAETHFVELACRLKEDGYDVIATSNGGVYAKRLINNGIKHYKVPLNTRNILSMIKGYRTLCGIVENEGIEVIHAHARIPAFLSGFVSRKTGVPLVSTVHGTYSTKGILKKLSNWGEKSLAVSKDLKDYLCDNYNISPTNITMTVNGINTETFNPMPPDLDILRELDLPYECKKIISIARLDPDASAAAFDLCQQMEEISKNIPNAVAVLVGGGSQLDELKDRAEKVNKKLGYRAVILTGGRTDVERLISIGDVAVGLSRAALEAMSCEKPVIIAGTYGYLGLFSEDILKCCIDTNFTARGYQKKKPNSMAEDIIKALTMDEERRAMLGKFGRDIVKRNYSVKRMAHDAEKVYTQVKTVNRKKPFDFALMGYYGYQNSGDDALLLSIIQNLRIKRPDVSLCIITNRPVQCYMETGAKCIYRFNILGIIKTLRHSKALIYGGGNLIQDITSTKSLLYYTAILRIAQIMGLKTMLYSNGIGPVIRSSNKKITKSVLSYVDAITLREEGSMLFLKENGVESPSIHLTADETLTLMPICSEESRVLLKKNRLSAEEPFICVSVRPWKYSLENFEGELASALDEISRKFNMRILFIPMHGQQDVSFAKSVCERMKEKAFILKGGYSAPELMGIIALSSAVIGMRLHSLIYGFGAGVPILGIVYDEKVMSFLRLTGAGEFSVDVSEFDKYKLISLADRLFDNYDSICLVQKKQLKKLKDRAYTNSDYAIKLLEGGIV